MAFLIRFGFAGENTFCQTHARPSGASPKPSATTNKTAREKYGLEAIGETGSYSSNVTVWGLVWLSVSALKFHLKRTCRPFIPLYEPLAADSPPMFTTSRHAPQTFDGRQFNPGPCYRSCVLYRGFP